MIYVLEYSGYSAVLISFMRPAIAHENAHYICLNIDSADNGVALAYISYLTIVGTDIRVVIFQG